MVPMNPLVPELECRDHENSLDFYTRILGFEILFDRPDSRFAFIGLGAAQIMLKQANGAWETGPLEPPLGRGINLQIIVDALWPLLDRLAKADVALFRAPTEAWYRTGNIQRGQQEFLVQDPDGYLLRFGQTLGTRSIA